MPLGSEQLQQRLIVRLSKQSVIPLAEVTVYHSWRFPVELLWQPHASVEEGPGKFRAAFPFMKSLAGEHPEVTREEISGVSEGDPDPGAT